MKVRGVIFDVDGTLVDTNDAHAHAWVEAFERGGYEVAFRRVRPLIGMGSDNLLPEVVGFGKDTPEGKRLSEWWVEAFKEKYLPEAEAFPMTAELLRRIDEDGMKIVVASSGEEEIVKELLKRAGAEKYVEEKTSASDVKNSKPDPDIIKAALDKLGMEPAEVVMVGDAPYDVEAARKLRVKVIGLRCGGFSDEELEGALAIYDDPADLLARYEGSSFVTGIEVEAWDEEKDKYLVGG